MRPNSEGTVLAVVPASTNASQTVEIPSAKQQATIAMV